MAQSVAQGAGITEMTPGAIRLQRVAVLWLTILPFAGFVAACITLWGNSLTGLNLALLIAGHVLTAGGITIGYHRLFTHQSFDAVRPVRLGLAILGSMAVQGSVISWVADHRRHHAFSDRAGDPHSPHVDADESLAGIVKGLWHAHVGWLFKEQSTVRERWAPDLLKDPAMVRIDRAFPALVVTSFAVPPVVGFVVTGTLWGAITAFLWGSLARVFLVHHVTWSINSICHFFGSRDYATTDHSTNNWALALISLGESWHNNHHAFPSAAVHGLKGWQIDLSGIAIVTLEKLRLARDVRRVTPKQLAAKSL
ncbi:MAG: acyl-CoA desaturase [Actinomycetota bacterium]|nr:acyl-CoA desaturase [Actinomycetota bacterium]